ncbi:hypothetical protein HYS48_05230 [Candidatus Woesearchaeota archaeon]|nr:hypothetical protein [Candidatus Woesearchaeota archaeon]
MALDLAAFIGANLILILIVLILSSLPLYFAVKLMGGDTTLFEAIIVNIIAEGIPLVAALFFSSSLVLIIFLAIILVYMFFFKLGILRALLVWIIQHVLIFLAWVIFGGFAIGWSIFKIFS